MQKFNNSTDNLTMNSVASSSSKNYRVIVADDDGQLLRRLGDFLKEKGFEVRMINNGKELKTLLKEATFIPHFIISDLMLPDANAISLTEYLKTLPHTKDANIRLFVTSGHNNAQNVKDCLKSGAADYVVKPFKFEDMLSRLVFQIQNKRVVVDADKEDKAKLQGGDLYLHLMELVLKESVSFKKSSDTLFNVTKMLAITLRAVRCSVIECSEDRQEGFVLASSDDRSARGIKLDLNRYPEVLHVLNTEKPVVIENLDYDPILSEIKQHFKSISFNSIIVCPVKKRGAMFGVMSTRMDASYKGFNDRDIRFAQLVANVVSLIISSDLPLPLELQKPA